MSPLNPTVNADRMFRLASASLISAYEAAKYTVADIDAQIFALQQMRNTAIERREAAYRRYEEFVRTHATAEDADALMSVFPR